MKDWKISSNHLRWDNMAIQDLTTRTADENATDQMSMLILSSKLGLLTLLNGRKWMIYVFLGVLPLMFSWIARSYLFGNDTAEEAFIAIYINFFFIVLFAFGTMLITLPVSADEVSDNIIDLYLVRPIRRDVYWTSRWISVNIGVFIINVGIVTFYWLYFNTVDEGLSGLFEGLLQIVFYDKDANHIGFNTYWRVIWLVMLASFIYSGLFLLVGNIGNRGFTIGMMLALVETFFVSLLFLEGSEYIPRTHLNNLAYEFLHTKADLNISRTNHSMDFAYTYIFTFGALFYFLGLWLFKRKQFN